MRLFKEEKVSEVKWWLSIDPGSHAVGVAAWHGQELVMAYEITAAPHLSLEERLYSILSTYRAFINDLAPAVPSMVLCELPSFWDSEKGMTAARRGDLVTLTLAAGALCGLTVLRYGERINWLWACAKEWKGQVPKNITRMRVQESGVLRAISPQLWQSWKEDGFDAVALGMWWLEKERK